MNLLEKIKNFFSPKKIIFDSKWYIIIFLTDTIYVSEFNIFSEVEKSLEKLTKLKYSELKEKFSEKSDEECVICMIVFGKNKDQIIQEGGKVDFDKEIGKLYIPFSEIAKNI